MDNRNTPSSQVRMKATKDNYLFGPHICYVR